MTAARQFPVAAQLVTMEDHPFEYQTKNSGRKFAPENSQRFNFNERLILAVLGMAMSGLYMRHRMGGIRYALLLICRVRREEAEGEGRRRLNTLENGAPAAGAPWSDCRITSGAC